MTDDNQLTTPANFNIEALIQQAVKNKTSVSALKEMLSMRKELKEEWAREEFNKAMAGFQSECPIIKKTKGVKTRSGATAYKYAPIEVLDAETKILREKYGFSYKTDQATFMENNERQVRAIVTVTHKSGHSEKTEMTVPLGNKTDVMSNSQVTAAAYTFAKRYAFKNAFGITEVNEDDESLLKQGDEDKKQGLPKETVDKINKTQTLADLLTVCKELKGQLKPELHDALRFEYTRRKSELEENQEGGTK